MTEEAVRPAHTHEPHRDAGTTKLNWLRAAVLGANDGIVATAGIVIGVAGATTDTTAIATAGIAGLTAGALSMAAGEYVSVSTQRDTERALIAKERRELAEIPDTELDELTGIYHSKGLEPRLAREVAIALTAHDALAAHAEVELGIVPDQYTNPWHAAYASAVAFTIGAILPVVAILMSPAQVRILVTAVAVTLALALTGFLSARVGGSSPARPILRNVLGGLLAMGVTYWIGHFIGGSIT